MEKPYCIPELSARLAQRVAQASRLSILASRRNQASDIEKEKSPQIGNGEILDTSLNATYVQPVKVVGQPRLRQEVPEIEPIPIRPPNYFASAHSHAEIQEDNRLAKASVIRVPKDLE